MTDECKNGHDVARYGRTSQGVCKKCRNEYQREYRKRIRKGQHKVTPIAEVVERNRLAREAKAAAEAEKVKPLRAARGGGSFTPLVGPTDTPDWAKDAARLTVIAAGGSDLLEMLDLDQEAAA